MRFSEGEYDCLDKIGGLPTHLPEIFPSENLSFIAQIYCTPERLAIPDSLCVQLYQEEDGDPLPVAIRLPIGARENREKWGRAHSDIRHFRIDWDLRDDPDDIPVSIDDIVDECKLMESKVGGTPFYTDDELPLGHVYLLQLSEHPAGLNFADRMAIVTMDSDGFLDVRLQ